MELNIYLNQFKQLPSKVRKCFSHSPNKDATKGWVPGPDALNHGSSISPSEIKGIGSTTVEHIVEYA